MGKLKASHLEAGTHRTNGGTVATQLGALCVAPFNAIGGGAFARSHAGQTRNDTTFNLFHDG